MFICLLMFIDNICFYENLKAFLCRCHSRLPFGTWPRIKIWRAWPLEELNVSHKYYISQIKCTVCLQSENDFISDFPFYRTERQACTFHGWTASISNKCYNCVEYICKEEKYFISSSPEVHTCALCIVSLWSIYFNVIDNSFETDERNVSSTFSIYISGSLIFLFANEMGQYQFCHWSTPMAYSNGHLTLLNEICWRVRSINLW